MFLLLQTYLRQHKNGIIAIQNIKNSMSQELAWQSLSRRCGKGCCVFLRDISVCKTIRAAAAAALASSYHLILFLQYEELTSVAQEKQFLISWSQMDHTPFSTG